MAELREVETLYRMNSREIIPCMEDLVKNVKELPEGELTSAFTILVSRTEGPVIYCWGDTDTLHTVAILEAVKNDVVSTYLAGFDGVLPNTGPGAA